MCVGKYVTEILTLCILVSNCPIVLCGYFHNKKPGVKYILQWTSQIHDIPSRFLSMGEELFQNCWWKNCHMTRINSYFRSIEKFDMILFFAPDLYRDFNGPDRRSESQLYVFVSQDPASYFPLSSTYNNYFNLTWTYKLDSDLKFRKIIVKNRHGKEIGPKKVMHWIERKDMMPIDNKLKLKLKNKSIAAAWFTSNCKTLSRREDFVKELQFELIQYGLEIDIYGTCGTLKCFDSQLRECLNKLENDYYFYLAFEETFDEDYVTEKLLYALQHYAVPIVYGGSNYTSFMPEGIYLDARKFGAKQLASKMHDLIGDKEAYYDYFRWHNHYSYHSPGDTVINSEFCELCTELNNYEPVKAKVYDKMSEWWNSRAEVSDVSIKVRKANFSRKYSIYDRNVREVKVMNLSRRSDAGGKKTKIFQEISKMVMDIGMPRQEQKSKVNNGVNLKFFK